MKKIIIIFVIVAFILTSCSSDTGESDIAQNTQGYGSEVSSSDTTSSDTESSNTEKGAESSSTAAETSTLEKTTTTAETSTQADEPTDEFTDLPINPTDREKMLAENIEGADILDKYRVKNIDELLKVIGRDRVIYLYPGNYNFFRSDLYKSTSNKNALNGKSPFYYVQTGQGNFLIFSSLKNTAFIGVPDEGVSQISYPTKYNRAAAVSFENCSNIRLENLSFYHEKGNSDSLAIISSKGVAINNCRIAGEGFTGLHCYKTHYLSIKDSAFINSPAITFDNCSVFTFTNTQLSAQCMYNIKTCSSFDFESCFLSDSLRNKFSFGSVEAFMNYYRDNYYLADDGEIVFDWISGLKDFHSNVAKIVFSNEAPGGNELEYRLHVNHGYFSKRVSGSDTLSNIGGVYIGDSIDDLYWFSDKSNISNYFDYSIKSKSNESGVDKSGKSMIMYDRKANQYYTFNKLGIPAIMNPQGTAYISLEELLSYDKLTLSDLVGLYGNAYTFINGVYSYKNGLSFSYNKANNLITNLSFGNLQYFPHKVYKLHGYLNDDGIQDTLVALYSHIGIQINGSEEFTYWDKIPGTDVKLVDINYDGISEIYFPFLMDKLYSIKNGQIINVFDKLTTELRSIFEYELTGNELFVGYKSGISGTRKSLIFSIPENIIYKKADGLDLPVVTDTLKVEIIEENNEWLFKVKYDLHLKTGESSSKPDSSCTPFDKQDLLVDVARITVVGRYLGEDFEIISADVTSEY
ncbi:MAG: hypothetical protein PHV32_02985 [Eubacteriales bacterium]|nr:hypothetical protein [Eubacteriales bacterium]